MRALAILLLSGSFVIAGDASPLENAVQEFKSRSPEKRNAAQRVVDAELRRMLAPLLEAMKDSDPEVRLRARESLLALIPNPPVQEEPPVEEKPVPVALFKVAQLNAQWQKGRKRVLLQKDADKRAKRFLASFGLTGKFAVGLRIVPGGGGYVVDRAKEAAAAFGLKRGDLILKVNGLKIVNADNMRFAFGAKPEKAKIEVLRAGKFMTLTAKPAAPR